MNAINVNPQSESALKAYAALQLAVACSVIRADTKKPSMTRLMSFPNNMR